MFGCSQSTAAKIVNKCTILVEKLGPVYITWPCRESQVLTASHFKNATGFPGVIGCIDGTHIPIHKPSDFSVDYYTRKKIYTIQLQGVCDESLIFTHVSAGFAANSHDSLVFQYSDLYQLEESLIVKQCPSREVHMVGDGAYSILPYVMRPFSASEIKTEAQTRYNNALSGCHQTIEHMFGLLKGKWKILTKPSTNYPDKMALIAFACCVLHNFVILHKGDGFNVDDWIEKWKKGEAEQRIHRVLREADAEVAGMIVDRCRINRFKELSQEGKKKRLDLVKLFMPVRID